MSLAESKADKEHMVGLLNLNLYDFFHIRVMDTVHIIGLKFGTSNTTT